MTSAPDVADWLEPNEAQLEIAGRIARKVAVSIMGQITAKDQEVFLQMRGVSGHLAHLYSIGGAILNLTIANLSALLAENHAAIVQQMSGCPSEMRNRIALSFVANTVAVSIGFAKDPQDRECLVEMLRKILDKNEEDR